MADAMVGGAEGVPDAPAAGELLEACSICLKPQRGTRLLLTVEKFGAVSWDWILRIRA